LPHSAKIGKHLQLGYGGLGCIIHADSVIGSNVHIGTNVTVGGNARVKGVPLIEDNVYIKSGAQILGPIRVGFGSVKGANAVVTKNVEPRTVVVGNPSKVIKKDINLEEYLYNLRPQSKE
jgi:serine O-acetyltransferase